MGLIRISFLSFHNKMYYMPDQVVVRQYHATSKLRVVYEASSKTHGPSLSGFYSWRE